MLGIDKQDSLEETVERREPSEGNEQININSVLNGAHLFGYSVKGLNSRIMNEFYTVRHGDIR